MTDTAAEEPTGFDDLEFAEETVSWPEVRAVEYSVISTIDDISNLAEGLDILAATFGRYGLDGFTILAQDVDDSERSWVLKNGALYTTENFIAGFEKQVDALTEEEAEAIRQSDLPVAPEEDVDDAAAERG